MVISTGLIHINEGAVHKLCRLKGGEGGGQKLPILLSKKMTKKGGGDRGGQKIADFETT